jgi:hypothetical protein
LDAEMLARTIERLGETSLDADIERRLTDALIILGHAYVLIGRGDASLPRRWAVSIGGRDYDVKNFGVFWTEVRRNLRLTKLADTFAADEPLAIAAVARRLILARGSVAAACARALEP